MQDKLEETAEIDAGKLADLKSDYQIIRLTKSEILEKAEEIGFTKDEISSLEKAMEESGSYGTKSAVDTNSANIQKIAMRQP
ncbi:MAG: hypothetical protein M0C28_15770, partial [Candidatus Moduliflexus flocculans]|nr:hypothetical protein [Candidatus Moduliflexus flocculans]